MVNRFAGGIGMGGDAAKTRIEGNFIKRAAEGPRSTERRNFMTEVEIIAVVSAVDPLLRASASLANRLCEDER